MDSVPEDLRSLLIKIISIIGLFLVMFMFIFGVYRCPDETMSTIIREGDLVVYYRLDKRYSAGDVVLLRNEGKKQIRRVAAVSGDTVSIEMDQFAVNGAYQEECYAQGITKRFAIGPELPLTISKDQLFVLGDDREQVTDSRIYGPVEHSDTCGRVIWLIRRRNL
ncbi:signal peptidase I [Eubacterium aggregans]|uniref:signal peptidase I n=1 Tax=Eubacterium aggregans TaxID=81409 RepID=UPI003F32333D